MGTEDIGGTPGNIGAGDTGASTNGNPDVTGAGGQGAADKVRFTPEQQAYINQIVSQRVNEVKAKYAQAEEDSRILQNLMKDPRFIAWLEGDADTPTQGGSQDPVEQLMTKDELSGKDVVMLVKHLLSQEMQPVRRSVDELTNHTRAMGLDTALQRLANQVDPRTGEPMYPYLWDDTFRSEVQALLGKRAATPEDAYWLVLKDRERSGRGVPQSAFFLESSGRRSLSSRGTREEEPEDLTLEKLGLPAKANIKQILSAVYDRRSR